MNVVMKMLLTSYNRLIWNGEVTNKIKHMRGLKQGEPISPYLFVLCLERLSQWIQLKVEEGTWRPLGASRRGLKLSHLFFTNDLMLFAEAMLEQTKCIKEGLDMFYKASGQRVNYSKSLLYVSPNIEAQEA